MNSVISEMRGFILLLHVQISREVSWIFQGVQVIRYLVCLASDFGLFSDFSYGAHL